MQMVDLVEKGPGTRDVGSVLSKKKAFEKMSGLLGVAALTILLIGMCVCVYVYLYVCMYVVNVNASSVAISLFWDGMCV
jgi:hypothetical protein